MNTKTVRPASRVTRKPVSKRIKKIRQVKGVRTLDHKDDVFKSAPRGTRQMGRSSTSL